MPILRPLKPHEIFIIRLYGIFSCTLDVLHMQYLGVIVLNPKLYSSILHICIAIQAQPKLNASHFKTKSLTLIRKDPLFAGYMNLFPSPTEFLYLGRTFCYHHVMIRKAWVLLLIKHSVQASYLKNVGHLLHTLDF